MKNCHFAILSHSDKHTIACKVTHLLYINDLKMYASSENNLERVMRSVMGGMDCIGLRWNEKKCAVVHVKRGCVS